MNRPLKDKRPIGPFIDLDSESDVESTTDQSQDTSTQQDTTSDEHAILETAETWYNSINKEENKRKMMKNYLKSMTDFSDSKIKSMLDEAGL